MIENRFEPQRPHRYVRYGRMSSDMQNERSPDQQFDSIESRVKRQGHPWIHVRDFRDDGISGRYHDDRRPDFQSMLTQIRAGTLKVDLILVDTLERFGRFDGMDQLRSELAQKYGVLVLTADNDFADPTTSIGRILAKFEEVRAVDDNRIKAHNVLRGKRDMARRGRWPGGKAPLGYRLKRFFKEVNGVQTLDHTLLEPDPNTAWVIRALFQRANETGEGIQRLARWMNKDPQVLQAIGRKKVAATTVGRILACPLYRGELVWGRVATDVVNNHRISRLNPESERIRTPEFCEPLVTPELWHQVNSIRDQRGARHKQRIVSRKEAQRGGKQILPTVPGIPLTYPLSGIARCGVCGRALRPLPSGGWGSRYRYTYYACPGYLERSCRNKTYVREDRLREAVIARLLARLFPAD